jgi:hypothetical protein
MKQYLGPRDLTRVVCDLASQRGRPEEETENLCIKLFELVTEKDSAKVQKEIQLLSRISHPNVVAYKGRTTEGQAPISTLLMTHDISKLCRQ